MVLKGSTDSVSSEEASGGNAGGAALLKKGPWTSAEDAILVDYVTKHGEGNWNAVQKHSGLARCGKSCRLRWANHLRPDLKKGAFTPEEERRIIELHAKMGNKWARMAAELPGRTDNEIKNYWNTRIKRRQRAGLPVYPPDVCLQALNEKRQNDEMSSGGAEPSDFLPVNNFDLPDLEFKNLELNQQFYPPGLLDIPGGSLLDIPAGSLLAQGLNPSCAVQSFYATAHPSKRLRGTESLFCGPSGTIADNDLFPVCNQYQQSNNSQHIAQAFGFPSPFNQNHIAENPLSGVLSGSHALLNGNSSSLEPSWVTKQELPSLQTQTVSWGQPSSPLPSLDSVDTLIQSPPTELAESGNLSRRNSGLLDAVLYESQHLKTSGASAVPGDAMDNSSSNAHESEWEAYGDPISPLAHSAASVFSEYTPLSGSSLEETYSVDTIPGCKVKQEAAEFLPFQQNVKDEKASKMFSRPDFMLDSNCSGLQADHHKCSSILNDAFGSLLFDDFGRDCRQMDNASGVKSNSMKTN